MVLLPLNVELLTETVPPIWFHSPPPIPKALLLVTVSLTTWRVAPASLTMPPN
jgi:hypothetical protein